jgi:hypothetical protein
VTDPRVNPEPIFWFVRCLWCWREVRSDQTITRGGEDFCSEYCAAEYLRAPEEKP